MNLLTTVIAILAINRQ